jgi:WD40 repeat protein/nucleoside-triphosphatase THEP1
MLKRIFKKGTRKGSKTKTKTGRITVSAHHDTDYDISSPAPGPSDASSVNTALNVHLSSCSNSTLSNKPVSNLRDLGHDELSVHLADNTIRAGRDVGSHNLIDKRQTSTSIHLINNYNVTPHEEHTISRRVTEKLGSYVVPEALLTRDTYEKTTLCYDGTRVNLLAHILSWVKEDLTRSSDDLEVSKRSLCIVGGPGTGKTTIATTVIVRLLEEAIRCCPGLITAHYCIRRSVKSTTDTDKVFTTIVNQLSHHSPDVAAHVDRLLTSSPYTGIITADLQQTLFLESIRAYHKTVLVIIDALDETSEPASLAATLSSTIHQSPPNLRLLLTTRYEHDVLSNLGEDLVSRVTLEIRTQDSIDQVHRFLDGRLKDGIKEIFGRNMMWSNWPSESQIASLSKRADGLFIWARTAVDFILSRVKKHGKAGRNKWIEDVGRVGMADVNVLYAFVMRNIIGGDSDEEDKTRIERIKEVLGFLVVAARPLPLDDIEGFLDRDDFDLHRFAELARSVLVPGTDPITGSTVPQMHKSFVDFITSDRAEELQIVITEHHDHAVNCAFKCMITHLRFNLCNLECSFVTNKQIEDLGDRINRLPRSLLYASVSWGYHLHNASPGFPLPLHLVQILLYERFLFWLEVVSLTHSPEAASTSMMILSARLKEIPPGTVTEEGYEGDADMADFASDAARLINAFRGCISESIPHIYISLLAFSPSDSIMARHCREGITTIVIPPPSNLAPHRELWESDSEMTNGGNMYSISFSPSGHRLGSSYEDGIVRVWDVEAGECVLEPLKGPVNDVRCVCFSPNGRFIASGSGDGNLWVWDSDTGAQIFGPLEGHIDEVLSVSFSPNSASIASGSRDGTTRIWNVRTGKCALGPLKKHTNSVFSVSFSSNGLHVASGSGDCTVRVWNTESGECVLGPLKGHTNVIFSVAFSPDGRHIASGSSDETLRIWDAQTGSCICGPIIGHTNRVVSVSYSPDGRHIASVSEDNTIRIWDAKSGACITRSIGGHAAETRSVSFSPNGEYLASGSWDGAIRLWDVEALLRPSTSNRNPGNDVNCSYKHLTDETVIDEDGWTLGSNGELLFWAPRLYRAAFWRPSTIRILGVPAMIKPDLSKLVTGREWLDFFQCEASLETVM